MIIEKILIMNRVLWNEKKIMEIIEYNLSSHGVNRLEKKNCRNRENRISRKRKIKI